MTNRETCTWAIIGAGPAGIAAVGKLIDAGVDPKEIVWIDPKFQVGDFGAYWQSVPSNTKIKLFQQFLADCKAFAYDSKSSEFEINQMDPEATCEIRYIVKPLQAITERLMKRVTTHQNIIRDIALNERKWHIDGNELKLSSKNVILAIGAKPKTLPFPAPKAIPLEEAMDHAKLSMSCYEDDNVAVFGSSHSAMLVLQNLVNLGVNKIINFYRSPLRYAVYFDDWILFDNTGLKGKTSEWARKHIDGRQPDNLSRVLSNDDNIEQYLPQCNKVIYAIGFERRHLPIIEGFGHGHYNEQTGILAPGLFGLGIAFPQKFEDRMGIVEHRVGLWKFMDYLNHILPIWLKYPA